MRIKLESMFGVFGLDLVSTFGGDQVEIDDDSMTLKTFIDLLAEQSNGKISFDERSDSDTEHCFILLNGNEISSLSDGLDTELKNGDEVTIAPVDILFSGG